MSKKQIVIDCAPGETRPDGYLRTVLKNTGLPVKEPVSMLFGEWTFDYESVDDVTWDSVRPIIRDRLKSLHSNGEIRYAQC